MSLLHKLRGIFIDEFELKKDISNMIAVSIFMDSIVRPAEVKKGYEVLENLFNGEDYDYLKDEVDLLLEDFQKDAVFAFHAPLAYLYVYVRAAHRSPPQQRSPK